MSVAFEPRMTAVQFELCKVQAELFESACAKNYDMSAFIPAFMSSEIAEGLDARFNHYQWAGVPYLLNAMGDVCGVVPAKHPPMRDSAEACYWTGYTYRFWNFKTGESSRDIYRIADYRTMDRAYAGYHTLSCDMAVDRLKDDFSEANNNETTKEKESKMKRKLKSILAVALCAVGFAAFAEPEISAVSAEGFLDLTVGDRVATNEETIVVDPAWGNAETATVKIDGEASARTYTCASNDIWDTTTALVAQPGRYEMKFTAGATNETAAFWKTGADWVVLDLPPYSTEGIEFQADKTYLALGQYEFAPDKTLTVLDGAKFEYGEGAGFKGGTVAELPKRYGTNIVEGGFFQIYEKIKGSEDNPWEVGDGVEAYTNGTELVIAGEGTITGLSEIPGAVVADVETITIAEPTVTGAEENAFAGYSGFKVTLPDNWQGELPKDGAWYGATGVELTRIPMAVKSVKVQQRYPWNGKVDVDFDLTGEGAVKVTVQVTADGKKLKNPTVTGGTTFDLGTGKELKDLRLTWDAGADFGDAEKHEKIKVKLTVEKAEVE